MFDKDFYNEASAKKLRWHPSWFGADYFDEELVKAIKKFQKKYNLPADGLCGPMTYRRLCMARLIGDYLENLPRQFKKLNRKKNHIIHKGNKLPIEWEKVILWDDPGGLKINPGSYYDNSAKPERKPTVFVNHWDVCLNSESCGRILNQRGISVHFCIDNDGTIYQLLDTQHGAWHCSSRIGNKASIGIEISNAYYPKYQKWYESHDFGTRPILENTEVHGKILPPFTGFYPIQLEALKSLWKAVHLAFDIPLEFPQNEDGTFCTTVHNPSIKGNFHGFNNHYNYTKGKIDCAGLDLPKMLEEVKNEV